MVSTWGLQRIKAFWGNAQVDKIAQKKKKSGGPSGRSTAWRRERPAGIPSPSVHLQAAVLGFITASE